MTKKALFLLLLALALLAPACAPDKKAQEEMHQEIQGLKNEIKALHEKLARLEAGQQEILLLLQRPAAPPAAAAPPAPQEPLSVSQLLRDKALFQGLRVTVRGLPGPVLVHRQTLFLKAPEGMVEVYFGRLPDVQTINRLSSMVLEQPLTITGTVTIPPPGGGNPRINAEAVEF
jgi:hypothetical protein